MAGQQQRLPFNPLIPPLKCFCHAVKQRGRAFALVIAKKTSMIAGWQPGLGKCVVPRNKCSVRITLSRDLALMAASYSRGSYKDSMP